MYFLNLSKHEEFRLCLAGIEVNEVRTVSRYSTRPKHAYVEASYLGIFIKLLDDDVKYGYITVTRPEVMTVEDVVTQLKNSCMKTNTCFGINSNPTGNVHALASGLNQAGFYAKVDGNKIYVINSPFLPDLCLHAVSSPIGKSVPVILDKIEQKKFLRTMTDNEIKLECKRLNNRMVELTKVSGRGLKWL